MDKSVAARRKARQLARDGNLAKAIQEMERILVAGEADPYDFVFHGDLLVRNHKLEEAAASYEEAISAYERVGLYRNAIAIGKKILRSDPHRVRTHWRLGDLYAKEGLIGDAVTHFLTFLDHSGGEATGEQFLETLERIAGLCGPKVELALRLSELYVKAGRSDRAAHLLDEVAAQASAAGAHEIAETLAQRRELLREEAGHSAWDHHPVETSDFTGQAVVPCPSLSLHGPAIEPVRRATSEHDLSVPGGDPSGAIALSDSPDDPSSDALLSPMGRTIALRSESDAGRASSMEDRPAGADGPPGRESPIDPRREAILQAIEEKAWERAGALAQGLHDQEPEEPWPIEKLVSVSRQLGDTLATVRHLTLLGDLLITQEDLEGALACFHEVLSLDPGDKTARRRLARFREMKVPGAEEIAASSGSPIRRALETQGATVSVREQGGVESQEWIDLSALLDEFRDGIRAQYRPEDFASHYDLGVSHLEMGLYEESIEEFDLVLSIPTIPSDYALKTREMRGDALQRLERFREAVHEYRMALEIDGVSDGARAQLRYHLACALERAGDVPEAREIFLELSRNAGEVFADAKEHLDRLGG